MIRQIALDHGHDPLLAILPAYQRSALEAIASCGTLAAGVHPEICDHCGDHRWVPNTCGHRSCPHCQARERRAWVEARMAELLPIGYFHAVLTCPPGLRNLAFLFRAVALDVLLRAASDAIDDVACRARFLGAEVGQLAILHTWTRDMRWHPHIHALVTGGGWDATLGRWVDSRVYGCQRRPFLAPVDVLRAAFRRRLRQHLLQAWQNGILAEDPSLQTRSAFVAMLDRALAVPIVIRIEPPFGGPTQLLKYLGAYINRTAVSPRRITYDRDGDQVTLQWRSNRHPDQPRTTTMTGVAFLQRFAQHVLPKGFHRIRFRGLWSTAHRHRKLEIARQALLRLGRRLEPPSSTPPPRPAPDPTTTDTSRCSACGLGTYQRCPGVIRRPPPHQRRRLLALIRSGGIPATDGKVIPAA